MEYIYLLRTRASVNIDENVYKIGKTKNSNKRFGGYMKGHEIYLMVKVKDVDRKEDIIKSEFVKYYKLRRDYGKEYFEGDIYKMIEKIIEIVREDKMIDEKKLEKDIYKKYLEECTEESDKNIHTKTLYEDFKRWYEENYDNDEISNRRFVKEIRKYVNVEKNVKVDDYSTVGVKKLSIKG